MTIRRAPRRRSAWNDADRGAPQVTLPPILRALDARDFERATLLLLLAAIETVDSGTIDDLIDALTEADDADDA